MKEIKVTNHMSGGYERPRDECTMHIDPFILPMKINSIYYGENRWVYKVTCDIIPEKEYSGRKFIIKPMCSIEVDIYTRLSKLQGRLVPKCHGVGDFQYGGKTLRAVMLEHADGVPLTDFTRNECSDGHEMKAMIFQAYDELSQHCVVHGEAEERHILVDKQRKAITLIDFDWGEIHDSEESAAEQNRIDLEELFAKRENRLATATKNEEVNLAARSPFKMILAIALSVVT
jgi:RIO-like serine/threonine protein kinase